MLLLRIWKTSTVLFPVLSRQFSLLEKYSYLFIFFPFLLLVLYEITYTVCFDKLCMRFRYGYMATVLNPSLFLLSTQINKPLNIGPKKMEYQGIFIPSVRMPRQKNIFLGNSRNLGKKRRFCFLLFIMLFLLFRGQKVSKQIPLCYISNFF